MVRFGTSVLERDGKTAFIEMKWSGDLEAARRAGREVVRTWLRSAADGCVAIHAKGRRTKARADCVGVLAVSPHSHALELDAGPG